MAAAVQSLQQLAAPLKGKLKTLLNNDLKEICRNETLPVSGVKSTLQSRIIEQLDRAVAAGDVDHLERLRSLIYKRAEPASSAVQPQQIPGGPPAAQSVANGYNRMPGPGTIARPPGYSTRLQFMPSPFYEIEEALMNTIELQPMPTNRHTVPMNLLLSELQCQRLKADSSLRIMVYCAADASMNPYVQLHVAFPYQVELKANEVEVKANLRGLKNKPGSTRPADITDAVRKIPGYNNTISITYALTPKNFSLVIQLVKKRTVEELAERIKNGHFISKQRVINEMIAKANDPDLVATSTVMSLKCPLSTLRLDMPTRSTICSHNQCFDATSFLQLQEQAPTWTCPVCNKVVSFQALAVDQYVQDILQATSSSVEQVTIEPNGNWTKGANIDDSENSNGNRNGDPQYGIDSDELMEISDRHVGIPKIEASSTPLSNGRTPPYSSRETSTAASTAPRSVAGSKRAASAVIDLTLSDDDDPPRPVKRQSYPTPGGLSGAGNFGSSDALHNRPPSIAPFRLSQPGPHVPPHPNIGWT